MYKTVINFSEYLFILGLVLTIYVYIGYPIALTILAKLFGRGRKVDENQIPSVSLLVSCFNEEDVVEQKIRNCLALDYPKDKLDIIFISDGSEDRTDEIVKSFEKNGIRLIRQEGRLGKTSALNLTMPETKGDIVVFSDANAMYDSQAIRKLVRNFADERIGYVVGAALYTDGKNSSAAQSEDSYWKYEIYLKEAESKLHSVVGGDGAIYAIRKILFRTLDRQDINDFVNPLQIIAQGYRGVFDKEAFCLEETAGEFDKEGRRKQRIVNRSFRGLMKVKEVMNPLRFGWFSFQVISHKLMRWLIPVYLIAILVSSSILSFYDVSYAENFLLLEIAFFSLAFMGWKKSAQEHLSPALFYPYYFLLVNLQSLLGIRRALKGDIQVTWSTSRSSKAVNQDKTISRFFNIGLMLAIPLLIVALF